MSKTHEVSPPEEWKNEYDPEAAKHFKKTKSDQYYQTLCDRFYPQVQELFHADLGEKFEAIEPDDEDATIIITSIDAHGKKEEGPETHPFVMFAKTDGQKRGGFEIAFVAREKATGDVMQAIAYFAPKEIGLIDVSWEKKQPEEKYRWA